MNILVVEDDATIAQGVVLFLKNKGFSVSKASSLAQAQDILDKQAIQLVLLDMRLPDGSGFDFAQTISKTIKVVFVTAVDEEDTIVESFANGAEDYITKPFRLPVLYARLQAIIKRHHLESEAIYHLNHLKINVSQQTVYKDEEAVAMSANERRLFFYLFENLNQTLTREQILAFLWDNKGEFVNDNTLTVSLKRLRKKIEKDQPLIETVRGIGYVMKGEKYRA